MARKQKADVLKGRDKLVVDLKQLQAQLTQIDAQGQQLIRAHQELIANRNAVSGAIQYIQTRLGASKGKPSPS